MAHSLIQSLQVKFLSLYLFVLLCSYVLINSLIHSLQVKQWKIEESMHGGLSDVRKKAEETRSLTLLQAI